MPNPYQRPKQPRVVRRALLDAASAIAIDHGLSAITVQAVADAAGVTKGGLLHHFSSKRALLDGLFRDLADAYEHDIEQQIAGQPIEYGLFTRGYIETTMADLTDHRHRPRANLSVLAIGDSLMRDYWSERMHAMRAAYAETDADMALAMVRFAADGYWLSQLIGSDPRDPVDVRQRLIASTRARADR